MPAKNHMQVLDGLDALAAKAMKRSAKQYRSDVIGPIVGAIKGAGSLDELKNAMGVKLFERMDESSLVEGLGDALTQSALIGKVSARPTPRKPTRVRRRRRIRR